MEARQQSRPAEVKDDEPTEMPPAVMAGFANSWRLATQENGREVAEVKEKAKGQQPCDNSMVTWKQSARWKMEAER
jgi:hypothetical protein